MSKIVDKDHQQDGQPAAECPRRSRPADWTAAGGACRDVSSGTSAASTISPSAASSSLAKLKRPISRALALSAVETSTEIAYQDRICGQILGARPSLPAGQIMIAI